MVALALAPWGPSAAAQSTAPTNQAIIELAAAGFKQDSLIDLIQKSKTQFDTTVSVLASLAREGLDEKIIRAMLNVPAGAVLSTSDAQPDAATSAQPPTSRFWGLFRKMRIGAGRRAHSPLGVQGKGVVEIDSEELPRAIQGFMYSARIHTSVDGQCPSGNVGLFLVSGSLPRGLRTTDDGLAGVPEEMGIFKFSIGAGNTCASATRCCYPAHGLGCLTHCRHPMVPGSRLSKLWGPRRSETRRSRVIAQSLRPFLSSSRRATTTEQ
jgi:hypothetical protein